ncbi:MAG: molybdopterin-binding protein, partial [Spirochaetales bacterium]
MSKRYLRTINREEALAIFLERFSPLDSIETVPVQDTLGRVTAKPVLSLRSLPAYPCAAMDGIAVLSANTYSAADKTPLVLEEAHHFLPIDTGDVLPEGYDAVIPWEEVQVETEGKCLIRQPAYPYQHVRPVGEDVVGSEQILPIFHRITAPDLGALVAGGISAVEVLAKPKVAILPSGDELVPPGIPPQKGQIPEFNSLVLSAYISQWGGKPLVLPIVKDEAKVLQQTIEETLPQVDILLVNAGSSAGRDDLTSTVFERLGEVLVHGVATRPGKPTILAYLQGKPCMGFPGYPVSAYLSVEWFL